MPHRSNRYTNIHAPLAILFPPLLTKGYDDQSSGANTSAHYNEAGLMGITALHDTVISSPLTTAA